MRCSSHNNFATVLCAEGTGPSRLPDFGNLKLPTFGSLKIMLAQGPSMGRIYTMQHERRVCSCGAVSRRECVQLALSLQLPSHAASSWSYSRPGAWGGLCQSGTEQSPVALELGNDEPRPSVVVAYDRVRFAYSTRSDGCPQINVRQGDAWIDVDGTRHTLVQVHWHAPAEHSLGGQGRSDIEAHFVHEPPLVLALLLSVSPRSDEGDPLLGAVLTAGRREKREQELSISDAVPTGPVIEYQGSLTTPPCTEGVVWLVDPTPRPVSREQLSTFLALRGPVGNARPQAGGNARPLMTRRVAISGR